MSSAVKSYVWREGIGLVQIQRGRRVVNTQIIGSFEPVVSPVDGSILSTRSDVKAHNERNGVEDVSREYCESHKAKRADNWIQEANYERELVQDISDAYDRLEAHPEIARYYDVNMEEARIYD